MKNHDSRGVKALSSNGASEAASLGKSAAIQSCSTLLSASPMPRPGSTPRAIRSAPLKGSCGLDVVARKALASFQISSRDGTPASACASVTASHIA